MLFASRGSVTEFPNPLVALVVDTSYPVGGVTVKFPFKCVAVTEKLFASLAVPDTVLNPLRLVGVRDSVAPIVKFAT